MACRSKAIRFIRVLWIALPILVLQWSVESQNNDVINNVIRMHFVRIEPGAFIMGSPPSEAGREIDEGQRTVTISEPFYLGVYEVTQSNYEEIMGSNPSPKKGDNLPVDHITWHDAVTFCEKLTERDPEYVYRLPTEAEWEYACRAGTQTRFYWGEDPELREIGRYAYFKDNGLGKTHEVGYRQPNPWGLYDMNGNVWEWCQDWMGAYEPKQKVDPKGQETGEQKVCRGGCWAYDATRCRSAERNEAPPDTLHANLGMRVVAIPRK